MTAWKTRAAPSAYRTMIDELVGMYASGALQTPDHDQILVPRTGAVEADVIKGIVTAGQGFAGRKQLLVFQ
ncbi:hypothetical protein BC828DRAFT_373113 [Blastocladiella britannica]|nr:hypothetical protein BC828DRAFT_373113 [Blastocladiella britannica]